MQIKWFVKRFLVFRNDGTGVEMLPQPVEHHPDDVFIRMLRLIQMRHIWRIPVIQQRISVFPGVDHPLPGLGPPRVWYVWIDVPEKVVFMRSKIIPEHRFQFYDSYRFMFRQGCRVALQAVSRYEGSPNPPAPAPGRYTGQAPSRSTR